MDLVPAAVLDLHVSNEAFPYDVVVFARLISFYKESTRKANLRCDTAVAG